MSDPMPRFVNLHNTSKIRISFIMANRSDCELYSHQFADKLIFNVVHSTFDLKAGLDFIREHIPQVVVFDPKVAVDSVARIVELVIQGTAKRALIVDDRIREGLLAGILPYAQVSYVTRLEGINSLIDSVRRIAESEERIFDTSISPRIRRTFRGWELELDADQPSMAALTTRELQVLKLLALGKSVRECAKELHLSESTIDNHKTRLMKKLQVHKLTELTHLAIRDGLIST
jgi:two-component system, NarL family, response regulator NreC